jgi:hypothetical protein
MFLRHRHSPDTFVSDRILPIRPDDHGTESGADGISRILSQRC